MKHFSLRRLELAVAHTERLQSISVSVHTLEYYAE